MPVKIVCTCRSQFWHFRYLLWCTQKNWFRVWWDSFSVLLLLPSRINTISESESSSFKKLKVERRSRLSRPYHPSIILVDIYSLYECFTTNSCTNGTRVYCMITPDNFLSCACQHFRTLMLKKKTAFSSLSQRYLNLHLKISYLNENYLSCRFQHVDKIKVNYISHTLIPYCSECKTARYIKFLNLKSLFWCRSWSFLNKCLCSLIKSSSLSVSFALPRLTSRGTFLFYF